ncbi:hypothetical protein CM49_06653 [Paenibacillus sp. P1XP2]|nr:hypothetical protein CM49_06653 [Paenibacillus sp. P1XP2]
MVGTAASACVMSKQLLIRDGFNHFINHTRHMVGRDTHLQIKNHLSLSVVIGFEGRGKASLGNCFFFQIP